MFPDFFRNSVMASRQRLQKLTIPIKNLAPKFEQDNLNRFKEQLGSRSVYLVEVMDNLTPSILIKYMYMHKV